MVHLVLALNSPTPSVSSSQGLHLTVSSNTYLLVSFISMILTMTSTVILIYKNAKSADKKGMSDFEKKILSAIRDVKGDVADVKKDVWDTTIRLESHIDRDTDEGAEKPPKPVRKTTKRVAKRKPSVEE